LNLQGTPPDRLERLPGELPGDLPSLEGIHLGNYRRDIVTNVDQHPLGRLYFDMALRLMLSYQHEMAAQYFGASLHYSPHCALAHGLLALCHAPNYNFKGEAYYQSTCHWDDVHEPDHLCVFPSQHVADRHSKMAIEKIEEIRRLYRGSSGNGGGNKKKSNKKKGGGKNGKKKVTNQTNTNAMENMESESKDSSLVVANDGTTIVPKMPDRISDVETQWLQAIRILTGCPGVSPGLSQELVGLPYAQAMRQVFPKFPHDPEIAYALAESWMVMNAWQLYSYPSGEPVSPHVVEVRGVLETALKEHPYHLGLCHMYVHLSEMSVHPELALTACQSLRSPEVGHAGHLIHMATHIDVLVGDYECCVAYNEAAIVADSHIMTISPSTAGRESFYFGYIVHNYHMAVYGCILGAFEQKAMDLAAALNALVNETMFQEFPHLVAYLESYSCLEIHTMIRFGRWQMILDTLQMPKDKKLMLYRACQVCYARALAFAMLDDVPQAKREADRFDTLRKDPEAEYRILHNNTIADLLQLDGVMMRGEITYREGKHEEAFALLRKAVLMQDNLNYDEPWGKMQPIRHALGGLLLEQNHWKEAEHVFRKDLKYHPANPWALVGLIECLMQKSNTDCCSKTNSDVQDEITTLKNALLQQRESPLADYDVTVACECCKH
jgi:tetratricopeptide (TPR) repeat protein